MPFALKLEEEISIPENIHVNVSNGKIRVKGPKGSLEKEFDTRKIAIEKMDGKILLSVLYPDKRLKAYLYTVKSHINNMFQGVLKGYRYRLRVVQVHFPMEVEVKDRKVLIKNFTGERRPREAPIIGDVKVYMDGRDVVVEGVNKEEVGQTAANIQLATVIRDKDLRKFIDGIYIYRREVIE